MFLKVSKPLERDSLSLESIKSFAYSVILRENFLEEVLSHIGDCKITFFGMYGWQ